MNANTAMSKGGYWLETQSPEYDLVKYHLITATQSIGTIEKLSVWKIVQPEVQYRFERKSSGMLRLQSFFNAEHCVGVNSLETICNQGFQMDPAESGILVPVGVIPPVLDLQKPRECCFIMIDAAVGRSYVFDGTNSDAPIPHGYDSLYIPDQSLDRNKDGEFSLQEYQNAANFDFRSSSGYRHRYLINDPNQIHPKYVLRFVLQKTRPGKIFLDMDVEDAELVDPISLQPSGSSDIKAMGTTSFDKRLVNVEAAYAQALEDVAKLKSDPTAAVKSQWVNKQLATIEDKVREINLNYAEVSEAIEEAAAQAQRKLQEMVRLKLELCLSLEIELRRQTEQVEWLDGVLSNELKRVQVGISDTTSPAVKRRLMLRFLKVWKQHSLYRNALSRTKPFELQALSTVHPDLRVQPDMKIFVDPFFSKDSSSAFGKKASASAEQGEEGQGSDPAAEFTKRARENNYFNTPFQSSHPYLSPAVRSIIDQEMSNIQQQLSSMSKQGALPLPPSISGVTLGGSRHQPLLSMHAALDMLKSLPLPGENSKDIGVVLENISQVRERFVEAVAVQNNRPAGLPNTSTPESSFTAPSTPPYAAGGIQIDTELENMSLHSHTAHVPPMSPSDPLTPYKTPSRNVDKKQNSEASSVASSAPQHASKKASQGEEREDVSMTLPQLKQIVTPFKALQLSETSAKKLKQLEVRLSAGVEQQGHKLLASSRILRSEQEQKTLFYSLPFFSRAPFLTLIYSTSKHPRSLENLFACTMKNRTPILLLIRSAEYRFGAYLSHPLLPTSSWSGSPACFIFSLTLDVKLPYTARQVGRESKLSEPMAFFAQDDRIFIGSGDLTIDETLSSGTSETENCFGLGLDAQSPEALCLLAGRPRFPIDELELWSITA